MLIVLVMVSMISLTATANDLNLQEVPAGYFLAENVADKIIEEYPELEQVLNNAMKVESGSYMDDPTTIELANKIEKVRTGEAKYKEKYEVTHEALQEERELVEEMKENDEKIIKLQEEQNKSWEERYKKNRLYNTAEKAGLLVIIGLLIGQ